MVRINLEVIAKRSGEYLRGFCVGRIPDQGCGSGKLIPVYQIELPDIVPFLGIGIGNIAF
jgi:hypothetical protein